MLYITILLGLAFAYMNGMHDGGTVIATTITSRIIKPHRAIQFAGTANFAGGVVMGTAVAYTISENIVDANPILNGSDSLAYLFVSMSFLCGILWNLLTWAVKLPSSASHALIGAMMGCGISAYGWECIQWNHIMVKVILAMLISPMVGFSAGYVFYRLEKNLLEKATVAVSRTIIVLHKLNSFFLAFTYGSNDAQKVMGLAAIGLAPVMGHKVIIPVWLIVASAAMLALGTVTGGYNMVKTVGLDICRINMKNSFASQLASNFVITFANLTGLPISATQVVTSSVMGVGSGNTPRSVNWEVTKKIVFAWIITIPATMFLGYVTVQMVMFLENTFM